MKNLIIISLIVVGLVAGFIYTVNSIQGGSSLWKSEETKKQPATLDEIISNQNMSEEKTEQTAQTTKMNLVDKLQTPPPSEAIIDAEKKYTAVFKTTFGDISITLDTAQTPGTASNFIYLAKKGFYDDTIFHRTIKDFMIQGGDPKGDGTGGPAYRFADEKFEGEYSRGMVAMANAGPNTNGSQFFILHADYPLPPNYVIFGKVASGMDVVDKIAEAPTQPGGEESTPVNPVVVQKVEIVEE